MTDQSRLFGELDVKTWTRIKTNRQTTFIYNVYKFKLLSILGVYQYFSRMLNSWR